MELNPAVRAVVLPKKPASIFPEMSRCPSVAAFRHSNAVTATPPPTSSSAYPSSAYPSSVVFVCSGQ
jgi:hypothetical protein